MNKSRFLATLLMCGFFLASISVKADEPKGAPSIILSGGTSGEVTFPHGLHQGIFVDCKPCHELFSKEPKVINKMKAEGKLQKKEVMNMCKNCHKNLTAKGEKAGPTACKDCHKK